MPTLSAGQNASVILTPSESYTVSATGEATVRGIYGAPSTTTTLTANFAVFGPYGVPAKLDVACLSGVASYGLDQYEGDPVRSKTNPLTGRIEISAGGVSIPVPGISTGYFAHCFAPNQGNQDAKFYDYSGMLNDGAFGAGLTKAAAWTNAGFVTTSDPAASDVAIRLPSLNFDYLAGESLLIFWKGQVTPEGTEATILGNTESTAASGLQLVCTPTGKLKLNLRSAVGNVSRFGGTSTATVFATGETHSLAVAIDGTTGKHKMWADGSAVDAGYASGFLTLGTGGLCDTREAVTLNIGTGNPGSTSSGIATKTQALVVLRGRVGLGCPASIDTLVANIHRNPSLLVSKDAW